MKTQEIKEKVYSMLHSSLAILDQKTTYSELQLTTLRLVADLEGLFKPNEKISQSTIEDYLNNIKGINDEGD